MCHIMDFYLTGSEDGRLSYGYSSFRGRRASMEDCCDVKISNINEQSVSLFGIFDGLIFSALLFILYYNFPWFASFMFY